MLAVKDDDAVVWCGVIRHIRLEHTPDGDPSLAIGTRFGTERHGITSMAMLLAFLEDCGEDTDDISEEWWSEVMKPEVDFLS